MPQLSAELQRFQHLKGAFDIIRYLGEIDQPADADLICDDLDMTERRFGKAIKRLVTRSYVQMNSDYEYFLTQSGEDAAEELDDYYADGGGQSKVSDNKISRRLHVALPRQLSAGHTTPLYVGIEADISASLSTPADIVLRVSAINGLLNDDSDAMLKLNNQALVQNLELTPAMFSQVRLKVQVFQIAANGEDIEVSGGLYVDVDVTTDAGESSLVAYTSELSFDPT